MRKYPRLGMFGEVVHYLRVHQKWWLIPIIIMAFALAVLLVLSEVAPFVSPFIYTIF